MGIAEIIIFAMSWLVVATLMLWGVLTERRRGGNNSVVAGPAARQVRSAHTDWVVVESTTGSSPDVLAQARMVATALLASRGIDLEALPPGDLRTEVTTTSDGVSTTRVLVRVGAMHASRRHH
jgi:hypothetical protein